MGPQEKNPMTTINDVSDLVRILRDQPEWAETIRGVLLSRELLDLPDRFARFVDLTDRNFQAVNSRLDRLESGVAEFKASVDERFDRVDERLDHMDERFDRMDERFDHMDERFDRMDERFDRMDERFDRMDERFDRMDHRMDRMEGRMDNGFGTNYEVKIERNIPSHAGQHLGMRGVRVLRGTMTGRDTELAEQVERAADEGVITWEEHDQLLLVDLIFTGRSRTDGTTILAAAEVSITAGNFDVDRAVKRARMLEIVTGQPVVPVVISANVDDERAAMALDLGVTIIRSPEQS
jgi:hypothetical protein